VAISGGRDFAVSSEKAACHRKGPADKLQCLHYYQQKPTKALRAIGDWVRQRFYFQ